MSWAIGFDERWQRDIGYGVPATCDHPGCGKQIDRGLSYVCCDEEPYGGNEGCGLYFCEQHRGDEGKCERCTAGKPPFEPTADTAEWTHHKATHWSWAEWRAEQEVPGHG
ncbi:hypothetical protein [Xylophilus sp.]|uniref:hypothetical protein n=1 Tax=Xylophilus sp. TaxID=2653893 RepID=UPI0013BE509B|nr:hypothetical protein [Xylophilus sp.]KAF1045655.1 MAG: hypothetical protein GAK38_02947 [Xylophilus sp.]